MNFVYKTKDISTLLNPNDDKYSGCYIFSRKENDTTFKLGMSKNLFRRLKDHKSCYPYKDEYWLQYIIIVLGSTDEEKSSRFRKLEKALLAENKHLNSTAKIEESTEKEQGNRPVEYRVATNRKALNSAVEVVLNEKYDLWDLLIVFSPFGWRIMKNTKFLNCHVRITKFMKI